MDKIRVRLRITQYNRNLEIGIFNETPESEVIAKPLTFVESPISNINDDDSPTMTFKNNEAGKAKLAQIIKDWIYIGKKLDLNVTEDFTREKIAMSNHLQDMRSLVFKEKKKAGQIHPTSIEEVSRS